MCKRKMTGFEEIVETVRVCKKITCSGLLTLLKKKVIELHINEQKRFSNFVETKQTWRKNSVKAHIEAEGESTYN